MTNTLNEKFKSGFIAIAGAPNAGKSTLLNRILGEKIAITSRKAQTTRNRIMGILHRPQHQMIFMDTPGVHKPKGELNKRMVDSALSSIGDVDLILFIADVSKPDNPSESIIVERLKNEKKPVILALNKIDLIKNNLIDDVVEEWSGKLSFNRIFPISARHGTDVELMLEYMGSLLQEGYPYYPDDMLTDSPERFIVAEMIREKIFRYTGQEIPYSTAVTIDSFKAPQDDSSLTRIHATIHVEHDSQKGIVIGKGGEKLKKIGEESRKEIERFVDGKVFLKLFVHVQKNWRKDTRALRRFGY